MLKEGQKWLNLPLVAPKKQSCDLTQGLFFFLAQPHSHKCKTIKVFALAFTNSRSAIYNIVHWADMIHVHGVCCLRTTKALAQAETGEGSKNTLPR